MWVQQKMVTPGTADPRQRAQSQMMLWMMPLMFAFLTMQFPSGLALYWVVSNLISVAIQYHMTGGWGGLVPAAKKPTGKDKRYIKRITSVEDKSADYADFGADISADAAKSGDVKKIGAAKRLPWRERARSRKKK